MTLCREYLIVNSYLGPTVGRRLTNRPAHCILRPLSNLAMNLAGRCQRELSFSPVSLDRSLGRPLPDSIDADEQRWVNCSGPGGGP